MNKNKLQVGWLCNLPACSNNEPLQMENSKRLVKPEPIETIWALFYLNFKIKDYEK